MRVSNSLICQCTIIELGHVLEGSQRLTFILVIYTAIHCLVLIHNLFITCILLDDDKWSLAIDQQSNSRTLIAVEAQGVLNGEYRAYCKALKKRVHSLKVPFFGVLDLF